MAIIKKKPSCKECAQKIKKFEELKKDYDVFCNQLKIMQADFENYKKRTEKRSKELSDASKADLLKSLLADLDSFKKAVEVSKDEGFKMVYNNLMNSLKKEGLEEIKAIGEKFDTNFHEAAVCVKDGSKEDEIIIDEAEKGYIFKGRVLKPTKAIVNKK
ncbi:MAG: nucleotide exchange factor GrpE [Candidatus Nanoarchaeia archaeon]|nr:nucleotide exchange factor GrpE [Candidatus Nanoarchaeia archaeon]MDD5054117.1 nucleotide exchange factor GrpE [Candidatus Nanoarchaeia archaeon]MDD5499922.1 nucleotide exchange factor GrpE [Candidatus Nanoarchaeia archaeon]